MSDATSAPGGDGGPPAGEPIHPQPPTPSPEVPEGPKSDLPARLFTASILAPTILYVIVNGGLLYLATVIVLILLGQREFYRLIEDKGAHPIVGFGLVGGAALPVVAYLGNEYHATVLMTAMLLVVMVVQLGKAQISEALESISGTFFGIFYVGWLLSHAVVLRNFYDVIASQAGADAAARAGLIPDSGVFFMIFTLAAVVLCDTGAYFAGRAYGKRKLAPKVSPGKTVEGTVGGVLLGTAGAFAAKGIFDVFWPELSRTLDWVAVGVFGFVIANVGWVGDLIESLLKRDAKVKDAGRLLPGTGGILDRIDSPLLGIPVMYYMLRFYVFLEVG